MAELTSAGAVRRSLKALANPDKAKILAGFFKTAPGEYAEGDRFCGVAVPDSRRIARAARELPQKELRRLIASPIHEERSHYRKMPRTMLRYAIERLPEPRRRAYLEGRI
jgi:hypothetical protein